MNISQDITVAEAARLVSHQAKTGGVRCPCCKQYVKVYRRPFNSLMARALIWLYWYQHLNCKTWVHVNTEGPGWIHQSGGSFAAIRHWGFIAERPPGYDDSTKTRCHGYWAITPYGKSIVHMVRFPRYVYLFNMEKVAESGDVLTDIGRALTDRFDYQAIMEAHADVL